MLPEAVALGAETRNLGFGTLQRVPPSREKVRQHGNLALTANHRPALCPPSPRHATLAGNPGAYLIRTAARRHS
jgi:hypothetical protein